MVELMGWHPSGVTLIQEPEFELLEYILVTFFINEKDI